MKHIFSIINENSTSPLEIDYRLLYSPPSKFLDDLLAGVVNALDMNGFTSVNSAAEMEATLINHPYLAGLEFATDEVRKSPLFRDSDLRIDKLFLLCL